MQVGLAHPATFHTEGSHRSVLVPPQPSLVVPLPQTGEEGCVAHIVRDVPSPNGDMGAVPSRTATTDLDFKTGKGCWRMHDGGTDIGPDVDDDRPFFGGPE